jgi:hypothetical protein
MVKPAMRRNRPPSGPFARFRVSGYTFFAKDDRNREERREPMEKNRFKSLLTAFGIVALGALAFGCSHTIVVRIPPRIDLQPYQTIGIVEFSSNSTENLNQVATQKFMGYIQDAQPQVRFLELGPEDQLLKKVGRQTMDLDTIKDIGKKYNVGTIFTGSYEVSDVKPKVSLGKDLTSFNASAVVNISMVSKHWDAGSGATIWTNSRHGQWKVGGVRSDSKDFSFNLGAPEDQYGKYIEQLAYAVTDNFRSHYERRKAPKQ